MTTILNNLNMKYSNPGAINAANTANNSITAKSSVKPDEEKNFFKKHKKVMFAGAALAGAATIAVLIAKGRFSEAKKLAEHIDFKKAETIEEAIAFGKNHLGIKKYTGFEEKDLDILNWVNEGLVNVSNKLKGKAKMPKGVGYTYSEDSFLAGITKKEGTKFPEFLVVNKRVFNNIDNLINEKLNWMNTESIIVDKGGGLYDVHTLLGEKSTRELVTEIEKYKKGELKTLKEKINFYESTKVLEDAINSVNESPFNVIKRLLKNEKIVAGMKKEGLSTNLDEIKKLTKDEQTILLGKIHEKIGFSIAYDVNGRDAFHTIYHEMGHLQDNVKRVQAESLFNYEYAKYPQELKNWVDNDEKMRLASRISPYACEGPGEFIAETFAKRIKGEKVDDDIIGLYKVMNGPVIG